MSLRSNPGLKLANAFGVIQTDALAPGYHIPRLWRYLLNVKRRSEEFIALVFEHSSDDRAFTEPGEMG